jgi:hypothetical protein
MYFIVSFLLYIITRYNLLIFTNCNNVRKKMVIDFIFLHKIAYNQQTIIFNLFVEANNKLHAYNFN